MGYLEEVSSESSSSHMTWWQRNDGTLQEPL
jgi:hypothetical protein